MSRWMRSKADDYLLLRETKGKHLCFSKGQILEGTSNEPETLEKPRTGWRIFNRPLEGCPSLECQSTQVLFTTSSNTSFISNKTFKI